MGSFRAVKGCRRTGRFLNSDVKEELNIDSDKTRARKQTKTNIYKTVGPRNLDR